MPVRLGVAVDVRICEKDGLRCPGPRHALPEAHFRIVALSAKRWQVEFMNGDSRAMLTGFIGRQDQSQTDLSPTIHDHERISRSEAVWLVLATHLRGLERAGVVDERSTARIAMALDAVRGAAHSETSLRGIQKSLEERVDSGLPDELRGAATLGLAREEWCGTALRISARAACLTVANRVGLAQQALLAMAETHAVTLMQGFHTGRPVQPVTFGHFLGGAISPLGTGLARLLDAVDGLNRSPLGAGSMSGEVVRAERDETAAWLGFREPIPNTHDAVGNVEDVAAVVDALASVASPPGRLLDELAMMVRTDPSSLVFDDPWMRPGDRQLPGFSTAEGLVALAEQLLAVATRSQALVSRLRQLSYGPIGVATDWIADDVVNLAASLTVQFGAVHELFHSALTVNRAYLANRAGRDLVTSGDLAAFLMSEEQLPPAVARDIAGLVTSRLQGENLEISAITPEHVDMAAMMVIGRELKVEPETLGRWLAPRRFLERRLVEGSPAPSMTRLWIEREREINAVATEGVAERQSQIRNALEQTKNWVTEKATAEDDA